MAELIQKMIDWYTKAVLTVIALSLGTIAVSQLTPEQAVAQFVECGSKNDPCYVAFSRSTGELDVNVVNRVMLDEPVRVEPW